VFAALYAWRDSVGRAEDESVHSVLPKKALVALATHMPVSVESLTVRPCGCGLVLVLVPVLELVCRVPYAVRVLVCKRSPCHVRRPRAV
jgi:hypothetical protein